MDVSKFVVLRGGGVFRVMGSTYESIFYSITCIKKWGWNLLKVKYLLCRLFHQMYEKKNLPFCHQFKPYSYEKSSWHERHTLVGFFFFSLMNKLMICMYMEI